MTSYHIGSEIFASKSLNEAIHQEFRRCPDDSVILTEDTFSTVQVGYKRIFATKFQSFKRKLLIIESKAITIKINSTKVLN